jgi:hypothetical protein
LGLQYAKIRADNSFTRVLRGQSHRRGSVRRVLFVAFLILATGLDGRFAAAAYKLLSQPVRVPLLAPPSAISFSRHSNGELFFDIEDAAPAANDRAARPRRVRIYWDYSASRADDDLEAEKEVLVRYLDAVHPGIVDLVLFSDAEPELRIVEAPEEEEQLSQILGGLRYKGEAPTRRTLDLELPPADACVYVSDGGTAIDPTDAERIRCPLFAISSAEDANRGLLRVLARRGTGAYFDLGETRVDDAVAGMTVRSPRILGVASPDGRGIDYALLPSSGDYFRIIGPVPKSGEIVVTLASGAKRIRTYSIKRAQAQPDDGIGVLWAVDRLHELCASKQFDPKRIATLARHYSLDVVLPTN